MRTYIPRRLASAFVAVVAAGSTALPVAAHEATQQLVHRSLQELVSAQGTLCVPDGSGGCFLFNPPVENYIFFGVTATEWVAAVDYAGLEDKWLRHASSGRRTFDTRFSGTVTERALGDGRSELRVILHTSHVAARAFTGDTPLFGYTTPEVLAGAPAATGESTFEFTFINPAFGMPLPDLAQVVFAPLPGQEFELSHFRATATGPLRAGFGVPDGTRGRMFVDMISTASNPSVREVIDLRVVGHD